MSIDLVMAVQPGHDKRDIIVKQVRGTHTRDKAAEMRNDSSPKRWIVYFQVRNQLPDALVWHITYPVSGSRRLQGPHLRPGVFNWCAHLDVCKSGAYLTA